MQAFIGRPLGRLWAHVFHPQHFVLSAPPWGLTFLGVILRGHRHNVPAHWRLAHKPGVFFAINSVTGFSWSPSTYRDSSGPTGGLGFYKFLTQEKVEIKGMKRILLSTGECFKCGPRNELFTYGLWGNDETAWKKHISKTWQFSPKDH